MFTIPNVDELFDETVSTWIEDDVENLKVETDKKWAEVASLRAYKERHDRLSASSVNLDTSGTNHGEGDMERIPTDHSNTGTMQTAALSDSTVMGQAMDDSNATSTSLRMATPTNKGNGAATAGRGAPDVSATTAGSSPVSEDAEYPTALSKDPNAPHLVVVETSQNGVVFAFNAIHLQHEGFRVSMPLACAFSGNTVREKLVARPLAFIDQSAAAIRSAAEVEDKHATHLLAGQTPSDLLVIIGMIRSLPKPFSFPMPHYVSPEYTKSSVKCTTKRIDEDTVTCFVEIPNPYVALQWLLHVNGTCGLEYALLSRDVKLLENVAWGALGDECRKRLSVWCPFEPKERFAHYVSDADFGRKDRGLAGLVVTDRRLIYCKYHHRGSISLDTPGTIFVREEDNFLYLSYESDMGKTKLVKLHSEELPQLVECLEAFSEVTVEVP